MRKLFLILFGLLPLPLGFFMNSLMMSHQNLALPYKAIGFGCLVLWVIWGLVAGKWEASLWKAAAFSHAVPLLMVIWNLFQELVLESYLFNLGGVVGQFYFLPLINLSAWFVPFVGRLWVIYIVALALMVAAFSLGHSLGRKKR